MKRIFFLSFFLFIFFILLFGNLVFAQETESPKYNFGSAQGAKSLSGKPGQDIEAKLYFYNIYGNRPTHVKLEIVESPENWDITLEPLIHSQDYEVSGAIQTIEENLVVYPSEAQENPGAEEEGKKWITSNVGYINADEVTIKIKIPENAEISRTFGLKINGVASWLGQGGNIALQQEREFEYTITTTTEYYEKPVEEQQTGEKTGTSKITGAVIGGGATGILVVISFIFLVVVLFLLVKLKKAKASQSKSKLENIKEKEKKQEKAKEK